MAYGQTGSGKSFTMQEDPDNIGVIPRAIVHIFEGKERDEDRETIYTIHVSYVEIYNEEVRDLLSTDNRKLEVKGNQGVVAGNSFFVTKSNKNRIILINNLTKGLLIFLLDFKLHGPDTARLQLK
jgi:hypothetical protein